MENTTTVVNEVIETVAEEAVEKIRFSTMVTGACAVTGAVVIVYELCSGAKWLYSTVTKAAKSKKAAEKSVEDFDDEDAEEIVED